MTRLKIIFMGTPEFSVNILNELIKIHDIVLVITQPDKIVGRKRQIEFSPVKKRALELGLNIFQPLNIRKEYEYVFNYPCDLIVTAAYGQIVGVKLLEYPRFKSINVHGSLLPKYRGGAPIQRSLINDEKETGITIMYMAKGMDSGDMLKQEKLIITDEDNSDSLFKKLALLGSKMILPTIEELINDKILPEVQDESLVTFAYNLTKEEEKLNFYKTAREVFCHIRGLSTNPGAYFMIDGLVFKVYDSLIADFTTHYEPGYICQITKNSFSISCKNKTVLSFFNIKPEGKGIMAVKDYLNGSGRQVLQIGKKVNDF